MATVGLVGGLGPESTIDYYRRLLALWNEVRPGTAPSLLIDSIDVTRGLHLVATDRPALVEYLLESVTRLARAGVDFAAITANTPHIVFDELAARSPVPLVSIVATCAVEATRRGLTKLLLLGTRFTMEGSFYPEVCARHGVTVTSPAEPDLGWVHDHYLGELVKGVFREETQQGFVEVIGRAWRQQGVDGVALAGTELPLLLKTSQIAGIPVLDTTALHVAAIVERLRQVGP